MSSAERSSSNSAPAGLAAAQWVLRHDRGLTAAEQDDFSQWLAADPAHRAAWAAHRWGWDELDRLAGLQMSAHVLPDPDLLKRRNPRRSVFSLSSPFSVALAAAAALAVGFYCWPRSPKSPAVRSTVVAATAPLALIERRELPDGSVVELNRGTVMDELFSAEERRVALRRGEAHFTVAKDAARPFIVEAGGVAVRAVGTAFNVRLDPTAVDVLVTEGQVAVATAERNPNADAGSPATGHRPPTTVLARPSSGILVSAGERTVVALTPAAPVPAVQTVSPTEIEARLAWQPRLLDFTNAPLPEIMAEFNRRNPVRLVLGDSDLGTFRLSATFRSDNVEGFVRLLQSDFGLRAERRGDGEIALVPAR
jgi:transmembrane sensor